MVINENESCKWIRVQQMYTFYIITFYLPSWVDATCVEQHNHLQDTLLLDQMIQLQEDCRILLRSNVLFEQYCGSGKGKSCSYRHPLLLLPLFCFL